MNSENMLRMERIAMCEARWLFPTCIEDHTTGAEQGTAKQPKASKESESQVNPPASDPSPSRRHFREGEVDHTAPC